MGRLADGIERVGLTLLLIVAVVLLEPGTFGQAAPVDQTWAEALPGMVFGVVLLLVGCGGAVAAVRGSARWRRLFLLGQAGVWAWVALTLAATGGAAALLAGGAAALLGGAWWQTHGVDR